MNVKKHIPNFITSLNLLSGCFAIICFFEGQYEIGVILVLSALIFDFLDGFVARLLNVKSEIGKQLDSLADMVTFGVVPGVILFMAFEKSSVPFSNSNTLHLVLSNLKYSGFIVTVFSAIRLAKFNIDKRQTSSFIGLPTPANTIVILTIPLIWIFAENESFSSLIIQNYLVLISTTILLSYLLIAEIPLLSLKFKDYSWQNNKEKYVLLISSAALLFLFSFLASVFIIFLYLIISIINNLSKAKK